MARKIRWLAFQNVLKCCSYIAKNTNLEQKFILQMNSGGIYLKKTFFFPPETWQKIENVWSVWSERAAPCATHLVAMEGSGKLNNATHLWCTR